MKFFQGRPWHTNVLIVFLAVWAVWSWVGVLWVLATAPRGMFGLLDYYVSLSIPTLIALGAYLLFVKSRYCAVPFLLLPPLYFWSEIRLYPDLLDPAHRQIDAAYFSQFSLAIRLVAGFFFACAIYSFFLNKRADRDAPPAQGRTE